MNYINQLSSVISRLPGVGSKLAKRIVTSMIKNRTILMHSLGDVLIKMSKELIDCETCNNVDLTNPCSFCASDLRDKKLLCVVESISDMMAIDETADYKGFFYIVDHILENSSYSTKEEDISSLIDVIDARKEVEEIILSINPTSKNQINSFLIESSLLNFIKTSNRKIKISTIAKGVPIGSEINYLDDGTIISAMKNRKEI